ncbi:hypothetical protein CVT26_014498 [Gymnopilus dilepis]|uniref:Uncharacterized protein n=1 Tax=Gymnopilus dilepis TaxID=231916 RepID=A0A409WS89_9AGAR|nr:hypothetical protein CVT26_014498 [Gymnopilus dilepis]
MGPGVTGYGQRTVRKWAAYIRAHTAQRNLASPTFKNTRTYPIAYGSYKIPDLYDTRVTRE